MKEQRDNRGRVTTLIVTVFPDEPLSFVSPHKAETVRFRDDFVDRQLARRSRRLVDERPQFALQRPMVGLGASRSRLT